MNVKQQLVLYLTFFLIGMVSILFLVHDAGFRHFMGEVHDLFFGVIYGLIKMAMIVFGAALVLGVSYGVMLISREWGVVRPNKYGPAQAVRRWGKDPYELRQPMTIDEEKLRIQMVKTLREMQKALPAPTVVESLPSPKEPPTLELPAPPPDETVNLSPQFSMHVNEMLSNRGFFVGTSGSGKSGATAVVAEEYSRLDVPYILFDTEGEYSRLPQFMGKGTTVDARHLGPEDAEQFGRYVVANHHQVVVNLLSYEKMDEAAHVMINALTGITKWEEERHNDVRVAIMTFLTEAHKWFPQYLQENQLSAEVYVLMQAAFFTSLVRRGRKRGIGLIFDTQKLQEVDKRLLQPDWKVCLRQTEDRSLKRYKEWGISSEEAMGLKNGEGFIYSSQVNKLRARMHRRKSPDDSKSPGIESIRAHRPETSEIWTPKPRNFATSYDDSVSGFDEPVAPFQDVSDTAKGAKSAQFSRRSSGSEISETLRNQILGLYQEGMTRTGIRDMLGLNGDEYWMLKTICDEYDRKVKA